MTKLFELKYELIVVEEAEWHTLEPTGGNSTDRSSWRTNADIWATKNLGQGYAGVRPGGTEFQQHCRWLVDQFRFWFRDPDDMFVFYLANTP